MGKGKDLIVGGLLCASITFAGYSHSMASQRFDDVNTELERAQITLKESQTELGKLDSEISKLQKALEDESQRRLASEKKLQKAIALPPLPAPTAESSPQEAEPAGYTDIEGIYAQKTVENLLQAGIIDLGDGQFRPDDPISRAEFLEWLVKANNQQNARDRQVRLANSGQATFKDVQTDNPAFPYVQGATDSGFVIGYDETTFQPDRELSREEMIAIKVSFDKQEAHMNGNCYDRYTDFEEISPKYRQAVHNCDNGGYGSQTAAHIWGSIKTFRPKQSVTRAEAALCVERIKAKYGYQSVGAKK